mgnify:CR=1 FL=1
MLSHAEASENFIADAERTDWHDETLWFVRAKRDKASKVLPEWEPNRSRPQRNAYHRYTVDRHLWQTVANAAALADRVSRPDLLV